MTTEAGRTLDAQAANDDEATTVMCVAFSYFDEIGVDETASFEDFAEWAADEVDQTTRKKAQDVYDHVTELSDGDVSALADVYCDAS